MPASDKFWRNLKSMHVVFAFSSVALFASTIWMMGADHSRGWPGYQREFFDIEALKVRAEQQAVESPEYQAEIARLQQQLDQAQAIVAEKEAELNEYRESLRKAELAFDIAERAVKTQRQVRGVAAANYDLGVRDELPGSELERLYAVYEREDAKVKELELELQSKQAVRDAAQKALDEQIAATGLTAARENLDKAREDFNRLTTTLLKIDPEGFAGIKHKFMEWYIVDGFNSHLKIQNDWLPDLEIKLGMAKSDRFDRCRTCHQGIERTDGFDDQGNVIPSFPHGSTGSDHPETWVVGNKYPHPYSTHPRPDLFVTASSPHPSTEGTAKFGCTICHEGQGSGTNFSTAAHYPNDPHQHEVWEEHHGFKTNHFWEYPMYPRRLAEASCIKCHHRVEELGTHPEFGESAPKAFKGYKLIEQYGCFGCHEVPGFESGRPIGPDIRLEPNYNEFASKLLNEIQQSQYNGGQQAGSTRSASGVSINEIRDLATTIVERTNDSGSARTRLQELLKQDQDSRSEALNQLRKETSAQSPTLEERKTAEQELRDRFLPAEWYAVIEGFKDAAIPGRMRKVGPSLRHVKSKTFRAWLEYWTEEPERFRPTTRMPQFFDLTNLHDELAVRLQPVEIAGIAQYLLDKSQPLDLTAPEPGYQPDIERGKTAFSMRCLACHAHKEFPDGQADFGPDLSHVNKKIQPGENGFNWVYTWVLDPERHHPRTKMPNLFLNSDEKDGLKRDANGKVTVDPAADIAAFLLKDDPEDSLPEYRGQPIQVEEQALQELVDLFLSKVLTDKARNGSQGFYQTRKYPIDAGLIKGDEIELAKGSDDGAAADDAEWKKMRLNYVGRRTISRLGCFGCHDIPGYETARPIATTLQDWGRKDTTKLALEHIEEYLHHHGETDGSSTHRRAEAALKDSRSNSFTSAAKEESEQRLAYYYHDLLHHGRAGFLFQKLRQPRSYDYRKIETKRYDERLRMPKFPLSEEDIEAIATFVLGLVAEPPMSKYLYAPDEVELARVEGERLLRKYNCTGCHVVDLPEITYQSDPDLFAFHNPDTGKPQGFDLLMNLKPPREATTGQVSPEGNPVVRFRGLTVFGPNPEDDPEDQLYIFNSWENLTVGGRLLTPLSRHSFAPAQLVNIDPGRGGDFARLLVRNLSENTFTDSQKRDNAWQSAPPPLYLEGIKVQTPWLYHFLREPTRLRHTTVLRMPKFNMSDEEARSLANYFAAVDGVPFPYQEIPQREPDYLPEQVLNNPAAYPKIGTNEDYLREGWKLLNNPKACINCHSVGGNQVQISDPQKDIRGPDLKYTSDRLRPEWLMLWLYRPAWITPYTSMPALFSGTEAKFGKDENNQDIPDYPLGGQEEVPPVEAEATRDALMNYYRLLEQHGRIEIPVPKVPATAGNQ